MLKIDLSFVLWAVGITMMCSAATTLWFSHPHTVIRSNAGGAALAGLALIVAGILINVF